MLRSPPVTDPAPIEVVRNAEKSRFEAVIDGRTAYAEYRELQNGILFPHTEVPVELEGRGVGSALAEAALAWAREEGRVVMPTCTFFAGYIRRRPDAYRDLVQPDYRAALGL
jgi:predicted GNAT family acetyltransferase